VEKTCLISPAEFNLAYHENQFHKQQITLDLHRDPKTSLAGFYKARELTKHDSETSSKKS